MDHSESLDLCRQLVFETEFADEVENDFGVLIVT